jgi:DNA-binding winged helix-turn-helix (wHTH) protein
VIYVFEDYLLDPDRRELRHGGRVVAVEPQVFDILHHLIRNRDRVISSADLKTNVWKGRTVSPSTVAAGSPRSAGSSATVATANG